MGVRCKILPICACHLSDRENAELEQLYAKLAKWVEQADRSVDPYRSIVLQHIAAIEGAIRYLEESDSLA